MLVFTCCRVISSDDSADEWCSRRTCRHAKPFILVRASSLSEFCLPSFLVVFAKKMCATLCATLLCATVTLSQCHSRTVNYFRIAQHHGGKHVVNDRGLSNAISIDLDSLLTL